MRVSSIALSKPLSRRKCCSQTGHKLRISRNKSSDGLDRGQGGAGRLPRARRRSSSGASLFVDKVEASAVVVLEAA